MKAFYAARYRIDIGLHVFPTDKYPLIHARLLETGVLRPDDFVEPAPVTWEQLSLVHTAEYLDKLRDGSMTREELAQLELPWSPEIVEGFRLMVGGTVEAAQLVTGAVRDANGAAIAAHIGGGFHHAFANHGEGFCLFNDVAVAIRVLQAAGRERHAVIDLDVHHGNGTAFIFENDPRVFTFSMHQQHNYPMWKPAGTFDLGLPDGAHDATYLSLLEQALPKVLAHRPDCAFYLAGADPYEDDQLGGLRLTKAGLRRRDEIILSTLVAARIPTVVVLAGGYARRIADTVDIHAATIEEAVRIGR